MLTPIPTSNEDTQGYTHTCILPLLFTCITCYVGTINFTFIPKQTISVPEINVEELSKESRIVYLSVSEFNKSQILTTMGINVAVFGKMFQNGLVHRERR
jgi:hypothetical protein